MRPNLVRTMLAVGSVAASLVIGNAAYAPEAAQAAAPGPPLQTPASTLQAALSCSSNLAGATQTPVLLVPGTVESPQSAYSWGYQKVLLAQGYPVCVVTLPNGGTQDMQTTVEYVVNAIRYMSSTAGRKISVIGHSEGGLLSAWALRFWPDLAGVVDDVVSLDSPYGGSRLVDHICGADYCPELGWQITRNSNWTAALRRFPIPAGPSYTSLGSTITDLVYPAPDATMLPGATNLEIQSLCPNRTVNHLDFLWDAPTYALVMDALTHAGPASLTRTGTGACSQSTFPGVDQSQMQTLIMILNDLLNQLWKAPFVTAEPRLRDYAVGALGDTNIALHQPVTVSSTQDPYYGSNLVDGDYSTRWGSAWWTDPSWFYVDLGATKTVNGVQLSWETAYATDYDVLYWNGTAWVSAYHTSSGGGHNEFIPLNGIATRYIAVQGNRRATGYGYSLWEAVVAGH